MGWRQFWDRYKEARRKFRLFDEMLGADVRVIGGTPHIDLPQTICAWCAERPPARSYEYERRPARTDEDIFGMGRQDWKLLFSVTMSIPYCEECWNSWAGSTETDPPLLAAVVQSVIVPRSAQFAGSGVHETAYVGADILFVNAKYAALFAQTMGGRLHTYREGKSHSHRQWGSPLGGGGGPGSPTRQQPRDRVLAGLNHRGMRHANPCGETTKGRCTASGLPSEQG
jgi:hypothetical protein